MSFIPFVAANSVNNDLDVANAISCGVFLVANFSVRAVASLGYALSATQVRVWGRFSLCVIPGVIALSFVRCPIKEVNSTGIKSFLLHPVPPPN